MKRIEGVLVLTLMLMMFLSCSSSAQDEYKRYDIESGIIEYVSTDSGKILMSTTSANGTESVSFKNYGATEIRESKSKSTITTKIFGHKKVEESESHSIIMLENGKNFVVDFDEKVIYEKRDMATDMIAAFQPNTGADAGDVGKSTIDGIGEKLREEEFLGYNCDVIKTIGVTLWIYKGVTLKSISKVAGTTMVMEAVSAKFNLSVPDSNFDLPDFPVQRLDMGGQPLMDGEEMESFDKDDVEELDETLDKISEMSFEEWKKLVQMDDEEMQAKSDEQLRKEYDDMQKMLKLREELGF